MSDRREQQPLVPPHDVSARAETEPRDVPQAGRFISDHEMNRRGAMANAKLDITKTMSAFTLGNGGLTAMEWVNVLHECAARMLAHGLREEWNENNTDA